MLESFWGNSQRFTADDECQGKFVAGVEIRSAVGRLFDSNGVVAVFFEVFDAIDRRWAVFPGNPFPSTDGRAVDFDIGRSDYRAAKINFFGSQGVGQAEKSTDIVSVNDVVQYQDQRMTLDIFLIFAS